MIKDSISFKYNVDSNGNPVSLFIEDEQRQVSPYHNTIQLAQIPDIFFRVVVKKIDGTLLKEVYNFKELTSSTFYCDYAHGLIYFHEFNRGKTFKIDYYGRGVELIHPNRLIVDDNILGIENIEELISANIEALKLTEQLREEELIRQQNETIRIQSENKRDQRYEEAEGIRDGMYRDAEAIRQIVFNESEVNRNIEEINRQLAESTRNERYENAELERNQSYANYELERDVMFSSEQNEREAEYLTWKDIVLDENNVVRLQAQIDELKAKLQKVPTMDLLE